MRKQRLTRLSEERGRQEAHLPSGIATALIQVCMSLTIYTNYTHNRSETAYGPLPPECLIHLFRKFPYTGFPCYLCPDSVEEAGRDLKRSASQVLGIKGLRRRHPAGTILRLALVPQKAFKGHPQCTVLSKPRVDFPNLSHFLFTLETPGAEATDVDSGARATPGQKHKLTLLSSIRPDEETHFPST